MLFRCISFIKLLFIKLKLSLHLNCLYLNASIDQVWILSLCCVICIEKFEKVDKTWNSFDKAISIPVYYNVNFSSFCEAWTCVFWSMRLRSEICVEKFENVERTSSIQLFVL